MRHTVTCALLESFSNLENSSSLLIGCASTHTHDSSRPHTDDIQHVHKRDRVSISGSPPPISPSTVDQFLFMWRLHVHTHSLSLSLKYLSQHSELFLSHAEEKIRRHHHPPSSYHSSDKSSRPHRGHSHITCRIRRRRSSIHSVRQRHRSIRQRSSHLLLLLLSLPLFFLPLSLSLSAPPPPSSLPRRVASLAFCSSVDCAAKPLGLGREPVP